MAAMLASLLIWLKFKLDIVEDPIPVPASYGVVHGYIFGYTCTINCNLGIILYEAINQLPYVTVVRVR